MKTKSELIDENNALRNEINALRVQILNITSVASALNETRGMTPEFKAMVEARRVAMNAAKNTAMRLRVCVKA